MKQLDLDKFDELIFGLENITFGNPEFANGEKVIPEEDKKELLKMLLWLKHRLNIYLRNRNEGIER